MNDILLTLIFVSGITVIFSYLAHKQKNSTWEGTLVDKKKSTSTDADGFNTDHYKLIFKTKTGKKVKVNANPKLFNEFELGKKYKKDKGEFLPKLL